MDPRLRRLIRKIKDDKLRRMVSELVEKPRFEVNGKVYSGLPLTDSPASISRHHSYPGGLIEHVISTAKIAMAICDSVEEVYHGKINRDLVISGVILHDLFKPLTYRLKEDGTYSASQLGERIDHLTLISSELIRRGFPLDLIHIVCAHHGEAGPITPKTIEALVCHIADMADSKLNNGVMRAALYLVREVAGETLESMNSKEAFRIVQLKTELGWDGVKKALEEIRRGEGDGEG